MDDWLPVIVLGVYALICGFISEEIGVSKHRRFWGSFAWGFWLGILGIIIVACLPRGEKPAPTGMVAVSCPRCNAQQNVPSRAGSYDCWQCKTPITVVVAS